MGFKFQLLMYSFLITIFFLPQIFQVILLLLCHIFSAPSALEPATTLSTFPEMKPAAALLWACRAPRAQCLVYTHLMLWDRPLPWLGSCEWSWVWGPGHFTTRGLQRLLRSAGGMPADNTGFPGSSHTN